VKFPLIATGALILIAADRDLSTTYTAETALRVDTKIDFEVETTAMSMTRDGEPVEGRGGFGGGGTSGSTHSVVVDRYQTVAGGAPTKVKRSWTDLEGETTMSFGGEDRSMTMESDFDDLVVEISVDEDGEVAAEVVDGSGPEVEVLSHLRPGLALDAFLPSGAVAEDAEWALESESVLRGLGLDVPLFHGPPRGGPGGPGGGGGGGGGRRGGFGGGRGGSLDSQLAGAEWSGRATFAGQEVFEDVECARIALQLEGESDTEDDSTSANFKVKLEGSLWIDLGAKRPMALELEGGASSEMDMSRERDGSVTEIHRETEGTYKLKVRVESTAFAEEE